MSSAEPTPDAVERFRSTLKDGDMVAAFWQIKQLSTDDAANLMLRAGFSVSYYKKSVSGFWEKAQSDIVKACRNRMDGYELREPSSF